MSKKAICAPQPAQFVELISSISKLDAIALRLDGVGLSRASNSIRHVVELMKVDCEQLQDSAYRELAKRRKLLPTA